MSDNEVLAAVAGVSVRKPERIYRVEGLPAGAAVLERNALDPRIEHASLRLELSPAVAQQCGERGSSDAREVRFLMSRWFSVRDRARQMHKPGEAQAWRALLVDHRLLGHPEHLVPGAEWAERPPEAAEGPALDEAGIAALAGLRARLEELLREGERGPSFFALQCEECQQVSQQRQRAERPRDRSPFRGLWVQVAQAIAMVGQGSDCAHVSLGARALRALCQRNPELVFELAGWLVPDRLPSEGGEDGRAPRRFVLEAQVLEGIISSWLLDERARRVRHSYLYGYGGEGARRERRVFYLSAAARKAQAGSQLPAELRVGVGFAASAWGCTAALEQLAWVPASAGEDAAPRLPSFDPAARDPVDVPRILPEALPAPSPQLERRRPEAPRGRKTAASRSTATRSGRKRAK